MDLFLRSIGHNFNPRPPRGGRQRGERIPRDQIKFQSTPSARRATSEYILCSFQRRYFNPRPPRGGRQWRQSLTCLMWIYFNPRPPRGGRHKVFREFLAAILISIHALREEGDMGAVEKMANYFDFNPRPPRGGRQAKAAKKSNAFVPLYTLVHNLKRNFTKAPAK